MMTPTTPRPIARSAAGQSVRRLLSLALLALALLGSAARAAEEKPLLSPEWREALKPLTGMPVQDFGYVRSFYTFGQNHLTAITSRASLNGLNPVEAIVYLMANPEEAHKLPLIKVNRPELARLFGDKCISLNLYRSQEVQSRMMEALQRNPKLMDSAQDVDARAGHLESLEKEFAAIPRPGEWLSPAQTPPVRDAAAGSLDGEIARQWDALKQAVRANDPASGGNAAQALATAVAAAAAQQKVQLPRLGLDVFYHHHQPFRVSAVFYILAAVVFGASLILGRKSLGWVGFALMSLGLVEQIVGVSARWMLAGRAPLSNMYESFTFATAGMVVVALAFEAVNRMRLAGLGGAVLGFIFMVLADKAPIFDSQIKPLMPALQSSWLTYHVVTIMLSYSAFALSFFVSMAYLGKDLLGGDVSPNGLLRRIPSMDALDTFNYKVVAVGFPLLTLGIILGAVWAATAWGRPWGFDPKETWSAITWLIYAIYLHARYLAGWKGRRAAILSLIGFAGVLFTYLGVNYWLPGLHSYASQ